MAECSEVKNINLLKVDGVKKSQKYVEIQRERFGHVGTCKRLNIRRKKKIDR